MRPAPSGVVWAIGLGAVASVLLGLYSGPLLESLKGSGFPMLSPGAKLTRATAADPKYYTTPEQRQIRAAQQLEEFRRMGGSAGFGPPAAKSKAGVTPAKKGRRPADRPAGKRDEEN